MDINIPKTSTISHELPIFNELSQDSGIPISEVKARFRNKMLELHQKALDDPSTMPMGADSQELVHQAINELRGELQHPEEAKTDEDEFDDILGFDPTQPVPGSDIFNSPEGTDSFGGSGGGFGGGIGDSFSGGGIDNMDLGFSDEGMAAIDSVSNDEFGDFGSEADAGSVNAMSDIEPTGSSQEEQDTKEGGTDVPPPEESSDLAEA